MTSIEKPGAFPSPGKAALWLGPEKPTADNHAITPHPETGSSLSHRLVKVSNDSFPVYLGTKVSEIEKIWQKCEIALKCFFIMACMYTAISYAIVPLILTNLSNLYIFLFIFGKIGEKIQKDFYPFFNIQVVERAAQNKIYPVNIRAFKNSQESFEGKKRLIREARDSVFLSGNYCGKQAFQEVLNILVEKLQENPRLKVIILSSSLFLTARNYATIDQLNNYLHFHFIITDTVYTHTHCFHKSINHIKGLTVDGRKAIIGGDGVENKYAYSQGIGDKRVERPVLETDEMRNEELSLMGSIAELILPRGFRDFSHEIAGDEFCRHAAKELYNFAKYWTQLYGNGYGEGKPIRFTFEGSPAQRARAQRLNFSKELTAKAEFFAISPELSHNHYQDRMIDLVNQAQNNNCIYIDHMYFQPAESLMDALVRAANRGVKLLIVTNGCEKFSPKAHKSFGDLNRASYLELIERIDDNSKKNIEVYEYGQKYSNTPRKTTLHKKVMVVETPDGSFVIFGNGNLGFKSMVKQSDYEIGVVVRDKTLADTNIELIKDDAFGIKRICHNSRGKEIIHASGPSIGKIKKAPLSRAIFTDGQWRQNSVAGGPKGPPQINRTNLAVQSFLRPLNG